MYDSIDAVDEIRMLTKEEAAVVRAANPPLSPWRIVIWQILIVVTLGVLALVATQKWSMVYSVIWGGLCVLVPSAVFARGLMSKTTLMNAGSATAGVFLWEVVKIVLTLTMLFAAVRVVKDLSWPALLVGLVVVMKVYWLALLCKPKVSKDNHN